MQGGIPPSITVWGVVVVVTPTSRLPLSSFQSYALWWCVWTIMCEVPRLNLTTLRPQQNGRHFTIGIFMCIFLNKKPEYWERNRSITCPVVGVTKTICSVTLFFQNHQNISYLLNITFIFDRCRRSSAAVTTLKKMCNLTGAFARLKISQQIN